MQVILFAKHLHISKKSITFASELKQQQSERETHAKNCNTIMKKIIVAFHIGRGGHFNNPNHKTFNPNISSLQECFGDSIIIDEDPETEEALPDEEWLLLDSGGKEMLHGRQEIESETGVLDWDGIYDKDIVKDIEDCTDEELELVFNSFINGEYVNPEVETWIKDYAEKMNWL